jgi:hypothetical protein
VSGGTPGTALVFQNMAVGNGGGGIIVTASCSSSQNPATKANLSLYLYSGSPTMGNDNANWAPTFADLQMRVPAAEIEFSTWVVGGTAAGTAGNCFSYQKGVNLPYQCGTASRNIWGCVVERGTYTPLASEQFTFSLGVIED